MPTPVSDSEAVPTAVPTGDIDNTPTTAPTVTPIVTPTPETKYKVGDIISLGKYDINKDGEKDDIEWIVTDITDGKVLLVIKVFVDNKQYSNPVHSASVWNDSIAYIWLNNEFMMEPLRMRRKKK